jgi:hypothetical protein
MALLEKYVGIIRHCISKEINDLLEIDLDAYKRPDTPRTMFMEALLFDTMSAENLIALRLAYQDVLGTTVELPPVDNRIVEGKQSYHVLCEQTMYPTLFVSDAGNRINWAGSQPAAVAEWNHDDTKKLMLIMKFRSLVAQFLRGSFQKPDHAGRLVPNFSTEFWRKELHNYLLANIRLLVLLMRLFSS